MMKFKVCYPKSLSWWHWTDIAPFAWNCTLESGKIHSTTPGERRDVSPPVPEHHSTNADQANLCEGVGNRALPRASLGWNS